MSVLIKDKEKSKAPFEAWYKQYIKGTVTVMSFTIGNDDHKSPMWNFVSVPLLYHLAAMDKTLAAPEGDPDSLSNFMNKGHGTGKVLKELFYRPSTILLVPAMITALSLVSSILAETLKRTADWLLLAPVSALVEAENKMGAKPQPILSKVKAAPEIVVRAIALVVIAVPCALAMLTSFIFRSINGMQESVLKAAGKVLGKLNVAGETVIQEAINTFTKDKKVHPENSKGQYTSVSETSSLESGEEEKNATPSSSPSNSTGKICVYLYEQQQNEHKPGNAPQEAKGFFDSIKQTIGMKMKR